jgi:hypothetical protein
VSTDIVIRQYCPGCEPETDPLNEALTVWWCQDHQPTHEGRDDLAARVGLVFLSGSAEAGGEENRMWCDAVHRGIYPEAPPVEAPKIWSPQGEISYEF